MAHSSDPGRVCVRISIEPADSHQACPDPSFEQDLTRTVESIRAGIPLAAHALHCVEILAQAQHDQAAKVGRKLTETLDSQSLI